MSKKYFKLSLTSFFILLFLLPLNVYAYGGGDFIQNILITFLIIAVIFLILREVMCWYWKINESISLLKEIRDLLKNNQKLSNVDNKNIKNAMKSDNIIKSNLSESELTELKGIAGNDAVTFASADGTEWTCVCGTKNPQNFN